MKWVLPGIPIAIPEGTEHPGAFGAIRAFDRHTGVDLYAPEGQEVLTIEDGILTAIDDTFTGGPDTPRNSEGEMVWLPTKAVFIEGSSGVLMYGEIEPRPSLSLGMKIVAGELVGYVKSVLPPKKDGRPYKNPANSPSMLHIELYVPGTTFAVFWQLNEQQPASLRDVTPVLKKHAGLCKIVT